MNVREEINEFASEADKPVLLWLFDRYHMASDWRFVACCTMIRYGNQSYQGNRKWTPTIEGRALYDALNTDNETDEPNIISTYCDHCGRR